jgi:HK97 family phage major capsid protein
MTKHERLTPGLRAMIAEGAPFRVKEDGSLEVITKAIEKNNAAVDGRLKSIQGGVDKLGETAQELGARLTEVEQKVVRRAGTGEQTPQTWGAAFVASAEGQALIGKSGSLPQRFSTSYAMKTTITSAAGSGGDLITPQRDMTVTMPRRRLYVRDLLPVINVTSGSVEYPKQSTRTNAAAMVAEGGSKPESAYAFDLVSAPIRTIAHWVPASRQVLDDAPQLQGIIDEELIYGLKLKEDAQLLLGDGTGQNLHGLVPQATAFSAPIVLTAAGNLTKIDIIGLALLQATLADYEPDGIVLHPSDWMDIRLTKDDEGNYLFGPPGTVVPPVLFGLPVVPTSSIGADDFLVGEFRRAATLYDRWQARVEVSTEHSDFFVKNLVAILAEERIGLGAKRPDALITGDFTTALAA